MASNPSVEGEPPQLEVLAEDIACEGARQRPAGAIAASVADEELQTWNSGGRGDATHVSNRHGFHPGTRVRVDARPRLSQKFLRSAAGVKFALRLTAALRNRGYWPFRNCYEDTARNHPDPGGKTELRLALDANGNVREVHLLHSDVKARSIASCHATVAHRLKVDALRLRRLEVDLSVAVWPGDLALLPLPNSQAVPSSGAVTLTAVNAHMRSIDAGVAACMLEAKRRDAALWGRLALSFVLDTTGHVNDVVEYQSGFGDRAATACISGLLKSLVFPAPQAELCRLLVAWRLPRPEMEPATAPSSGGPTPIDPQSGEASH